MPTYFTLKKRTNDTKLDVTKARKITANCHKNNEILDFDMTLYSIALIKDNF